MGISTTCMSCGKRLKAPDSAAGKQGKCPSCGGMVKIPIANSVEVAPRMEQISDLPSGKSEVVLTPVLAGKRFQKDDYQEFIWLDIDWKAEKADKPVRAVKGNLLIQDIFGETKLSINWPILMPFRSGEVVTQRGSGFEFNQFIESHAWAKNTKPENMKLAFELMAVVYQDGTGEGLAEEGSRSALLTPILRKKYYQEQEYQEFIWMDICWETTGLPKPTRAVKGVLHLADLFGDVQFSLNMTIEDPLEPGRPFLQNGTGFEYNQFNENHAWLRNVHPESLRLSFSPNSIIFADGTREDY